MKKHSIEQKRAACQAVLDEGRTRKSVGAEVGVTQDTLRKWIRRYEAGETFDRRVFNGSEPILDEADLDLVESWVTEDPYRSVSSLCEALSERRGRDITYTMLYRAMKKRGIRCERPVLVDVPAAEPSRTTRYKEHHRRNPKAGYPSSLTDAEWAVLEPVYEATRPRRGRPPQHDPRLLVNAVFYVLRSGCSWRMLPTEFPAWETVYATFRNWSKSGRLEAFYKALHGMWRAREGRAPGATAAIIDSQTVKTSEKGGLEVTMAARRSTAARGISQ